MNDKRLNYVRTGADAQQLSSGGRTPTWPHIITCHECTLGHMRASSVLNETFMSTKKSLDKQDKLDVISLNLEWSLKFKFCQEWGCHDEHAWQTLLSWLGWGLVLFSFQAASVNVITMSELQNNTISGELKLRIEKSSHIPLACAELWNCHECNKS